MSSADWAILVPAIVAILGAATAWIRAEVANKTATRAEGKANAAQAASQAGQSGQAPGL